MTAYCDDLAKRISAARLRLQTVACRLPSGSSSSSRRRAIHSSTRNLRCHSDPQQTPGLTPVRCEFIASHIGIDCRSREWRRYYGHGRQVS
jgi:hypothetical protein